MAHTFENAECSPIEDKVHGAPAGFGVRHWQSILLFFGITVAYAQRLCLSIAILAMKNENESGESIHKYSNIILSSFFWGYTLMQVPSGYLAKTISAKYVLGCGVCISGLATLTVPLANDIGDWWAICICRVITGLSQACLLPSVHTLLSKWVPPSERGRLGSFVYSGAQFGTVITYPISGELIVKAGWRSTFYFFGGAAIAWSCLFFIFGADSPLASSKRAFYVIDENEKKYIESSLGSSDTTSQRRGKTPWISFLTSKPFWALAIVHCGQNWGYWMLLTKLPAYLTDVLKYPYDENGFVMALPYLLMLVLAVPVSLSSDWCEKKGVSRGVSRKIFNTIGHWGPGIAIFILCFVPLDKIVQVSIFVIAVGLNAGMLCGFQINHIDLSPNFAGILMSITNCLASVIAILAPLIVGLIVTEEADANEWRIVFFLTAGTYFVGNLIFIIFGSGDIQEWNDSGDSDKERRDFPLQTPTTSPAIITSAPTVE